MKIFISGGCKNGKSMHAQKMSKLMKPEGKPLYYLATMIPKDDEDKSRIARHLQERDGWGFETVEAGSNVYETVKKLDCRGSFLFDSVTALLDNGMFLPNGEIDTNAHIKAATDLEVAVAAVENIVIVSDFIYSDAIQYNEYVEAYKSGLAYVDRKIAALCDVVLEACYGSLISYRGAEVFDKFYSCSI